MQKIFFIVLSLLTSFCTSNKGHFIRQNSYFETINISLFKPDPIDVNTLFSDVGFIKLDTTPNAFMSMPFALRVYKDHIYILDRGRPRGVFMFDMSGKFIRKIGVLGRGPRELLSMSSIEIDYLRDRLYITDNSGHQSMAFDLEGNYLFTVPLGDAGGFISITSSGNIVHESFNSSFGFDFKKMEQRENIKILDTMGNLLFKGFDYNHSRKINAIFKTLSLNKQGNVSFAPMFRDTIYSVSESSITPLYAFDFSKVKGITKERSDTYKSDQDMTADLSKNGYVCIGGAHIDSPDVFYAQLGFSTDRAHLFYDKVSSATHIVKLNDFSVIGTRVLFNGSSSAWLPYSVEDFNDGYFYGIFYDFQQVILSDSNIDKGTINRQLFDIMNSDGSSLIVIYFKLKKS